MLRSHPLLLLCTTLCLYVLPGAVCAQVTGDPEIFRILAETARDNQSRIKTWIGKAELVDKETVDQTTSCRIAVSNVTFAYSSSDDQLFFDKQNEVPACIRY